MKRACLRKHQTPQQRVSNARHSKCHGRAGIVRFLAPMRAERIPRTKAMALEWRRSVGDLLESDLRTANQTLRVRSVCRTLGIRLPVAGFETRERPRDG